MESIDERVDPSHSGKDDTSSLKFTRREKGLIAFSTAASVAMMVIAGYFLVYWYIPRVKADALRNAHYFCLETEKTISPLVPDQIDRNHALRESIIIPDKQRLYRRYVGKTCGEIFDEYRQNSGNE